MSAVRRAPAQQVQTAPAQGVSFMDLGFYAGGFGLPAGDCILYHEAMLFSGTKADGSSYGAPRLGVMVTAYYFDDLEHPKTQFYSMGTNADKSFTVDPDSQGKRIIPIAGAPGSTSLNNSTNWFFYLKSFFDCGLQPGQAEDLSNIDGTWATIQHIDEPESRKGFQSQTGESAFQKADSGPKKIGVLLEVLPGGAPWEGGGGWVEQAPVAPAPPARPAARPAAPAAPARAAAPARPAAAAAQPARPAARPAAARPTPPARKPNGRPAAAAEEAAVQDDDVLTAGVSAAATILGASPNGVSKLNLRTGVFRSLKASAGDEMAQAVLDTYFSSDDGVNTLVSPHGYVVQGLQIVVAQ